MSAAFSPWKPGANQDTSQGADSIPAITSTLRTMVASVATLFASRQAAASPSRAVVFEKVVTNAVDSAPSANRSRSRFGIRNAMVNASMTRPPPNRAAKIASRASPSTRLHSTARPTMPAAFVFSFSARVSGGCVGSPVAGLPGGIAGAKVASFAGVADMISFADAGPSSRCAARRLAAIAPSLAAPDRRIILSTP